MEEQLQYEIHVTVKIVDERQIGIFKELCASIGVKPIVLDLENSGEIVMRDVMTSSHHSGSDISAYYEAFVIEEHMDRNGFIVERKKIETVPWHPMAPATKEDKMPNNCYFESHIGCIITSEEKHKLSKIAKDFGAHLSKNAFKKFENGKFVNMLTIREYDSTTIEFKAKVENLKELLKENKIEFEKVEIEFCIHDSKINHDYLWLKQNEQKLENREVVSG